MKDNITLDLNIYAILENQYNKIHNLPPNWDDIKDTKVKNELLALALNSHQQIENLAAYKKIIEEKSND